MSFSDQTTQDQKAGEAGDVANQGNQDQVFLKVGERVFATQEDAAKSIAAAQEHIAKLEAEAKQRAEAEAARSEQNVAAEANKELARQILDGMKQDTNTDTTRQQSNVQLNEDDIVKKVMGELQANQSVAAKQANMDGCMETAEKVYGDKYKEMVAAKAKELNMSMDDVDNLAETSPNAFNRLFIPSDTNGKSNTNFASSQSLRAEALNLDTDGKDEGGSKSINGKTESQRKAIMADLGDKYGLYK